MVNQKVLGILFGVSAGAMWAVESILGKFLFSSLTFIQVTASEVFFATLTAFTYSLIKKRSVKIKTKNILNLLVVGLVGTVFAPLMYFFGLTQTYAINATLIAHLQPLFVTVLGIHFLEERLHTHDLVGGIIIIFSAILITSRTTENLSKLIIGNFGDLMVFIAMLSWATVAIPGKRLTEEINSVIIVGYRSLIASVVFIPILLSLDQLIINSIYQVLLGVSAGLGYIFYYEGLTRVKASEVALSELSAPIFTVFFAWYLLGEMITPMQVTGAFMLISGLYLIMH